MANRNMGGRVQKTIRIPADLHRASIAQAKMRGWSLNQFQVHMMNEWMTNHDVEVAAPVGERQNIDVYDDDDNYVGTT